MSINVFIAHLINIVVSYCHPILIDLLLHSHMYSNNGISLILLHSILAPQTLIEIVIFSLHNYFLSCQLIFSLHVIITELLLPSHSDRLMCLNSHNNNIENLHIHLLGKSVMLLTRILQLCRYKVIHFAVQS